VTPSKRYIAGARARALELRPPPPVVCLRRGKNNRTCGGPIRVMSYVLSRPDAGECQRCGKPWKDLTVRGPLCPKCGWGRAECGPLGTVGCTT
jgi:hypothetical protein